MYLIHSKCSGPRPSWFLTDGFAPPHRRERITGHTNLKHKRTQRNEIMNEIFRRGQSISEQDDRNRRTIAESRDKFNKVGERSKDDNKGNYLEVHTVTALCSGVLPIWSAALGSAPRAISTSKAPSSSFRLPWKCRPLIALCSGRMEGERSFQNGLFRSLPSEVIYTVSRVKREKKMNNLKRDFKKGK